MIECVIGSMWVRSLMFPPLHTSMSKFSIQCSISPFQWIVDLLSLSLSMETDEHLSLPPRNFRHHHHSSTPRLFLVFHAHPMRITLSSRHALWFLMSPPLTWSPLKPTISPLFPPFHGRHSKESNKLSFISLNSLSGSLHYNRGFPKENQPRTLTFSSQLHGSLSFQPKTPQSLAKLSWFALNPTGFQRQVQQGGASSSSLVIVCHRISNLGHPSKEISAPHHLIFVTSHLGNQATIVSSYLPFKLSFICLQNSEVGCMQVFMFVFCSML